jgi:RimJ/RimL family protein N-acetyltransferase
MESSNDQNTATVEILSDPAAFRVTHPIKTERLLLRVFEDRDIGGLRALIGNDEAMRFAGGARDPARAALELQAMRRSVLERGWGTLAIEWDGQCIGYCGARPMLNTPEVELAYGVRPDLWGRGIATEAASATLVHAFENLPIESIVASVYSTNAASVRVLEKLGMTYERRVFGMWPHHTALYYRIKRGQVQVMSSA